MTAPTSPADYCRRYGHDFTDTGRRRSLADEGCCGVCGMRPCSICGDELGPEPAEGFHYPPEGAAHPACCPCAAVRQGEP